jgi:hypothetical protein
MKTIPEAFALAQWLDEYPTDTDYRTILERIEDGDDESIHYIDLIEYEPPEAIIRHIESTKRLFALYAAQAIREARL